MKFSLVTHSRHKWNGDRLKIDSANNGIQCVTLSIKKTKKNILPSFSVISRTRAYTDLLPWIIGHISQWMRNIKAASYAKRIISISINWKFIWIKQKVGNAPSFCAHIRYAVIRGATAYFIGTVVRHCYSLRLARAIFFLSGIACWLRLLCKIANFFIFISSVTSHFACAPHFIHIFIG